MPLTVWTFPHAARRAVLVFSATVLGLAVLIPPARGAAESIELVPASELSSARVKVVFEVDGQLRTQSKKTRTQPTKKADDSDSLDLKAKGQFLYEERLAGETAGEALRYYEQAAAEISVDGRPSQLALREDRRFIVVAAQPTQANLRSLQGALTREELELLELPGGSHLVDQLLPHRQVELNESWKHDDALLAKLLNLDAVTVNDVASSLQRIDRNQGIALMRMTGHVIGYKASVTTEIQVEAKYRFDLRRSRIVWFAMGLQEDREVGVQQPGLSVRARVRMLVEESAPRHLVADTLEAMVANAPQPTELLEYYSPQGHFTLMHDRRWFLYSERPELIVMRMIEGGEVVAQCNLRSLPPRGPSQQMQLSHFQAEVRTALGEALEQIVDQDESTQPDGTRRLRLSVVGQVAEVPVHWIYYHLTDASGQVLTCVFTMSGDNLSRFDAEDMTFVESLTMHSRESDESGQPQPTREVARRAANID